MKRISILLSLSVILHMVATAAPQAPKLVQSSPPVYPEAARRSGHYGTVQLSLDISREGTVNAVRVLTSSRSTELDNAAAAAAKDWKFSPARDEQGEPTTVTASIGISFQRPEDFQDRRKPCRDLVVEYTWLKAAYPETGLNRRQLILEEFRGLIDYPFEQSAREAMNPELAAKLERALSSCRENPDERARDVLRDLVANESYYRQPLTKDEAQEVSRKVLDIKNGSSTPSGLPAK